jgi:tetratricopeptide (TPR) repeat protein
MSTNTPDDLRNRFEALLAERKLANALQMTQQLLAANPNSGLANFLSARVQAELGNEGLALERAEAACRWQPGNFEFLFFCGQLYFIFELYEYALPYLQKSVAIEPRACQSHAVLGDCYASLGLGEKAIMHFRKALKLSPPAEVKDQIRLELALCLQESNQPAEALPLLKALLSADKSLLPRVLFALAEIEDFNADSAIAKEIVEFRDSETFKGEDNRLLWLASGRISAKSKQYADAFTAWEKAAQIGKALKWNPREHQAIIAETKAFYSKSLFEQCREYGHESTIPVFIAGMPRSGTTLTEQIISAHSRAAGVGELPRWLQLDVAFQSEYRGENQVAAIQKNASHGELRKRAEETLTLFRNVLGELPDRVVEKEPFNFIHAGFHAVLFPNARFIHLRRHPADSFISTFQHRFAIDHSYALDQEEYAKEYAFHEKLMDHWKATFGNRILTVQYEKLASDPENEARRIIDFIGLPWEDQCLKFYERKTTVRTFSTQQVRQPVNTSSIDRWRVYEPFLGPLFKTMDELGLTYPPKD